LSPGQLRFGLAFDERPHAYLVQIAHRVLIRLGAGCASKPSSGQSCSFQRRHVVEEVERLEHHAHLRVVFGQRHAAVLDVPAVVGDEAAGGFSRRLMHLRSVDFAAAGRADDAHHIALLRLKVTSRNTSWLAKAFFQVLDADDRAVHLGAPLSTLMTE
jgi:hypothetical protein